MRISERPQSVGGAMGRSTAIFQKQRAMITGKSGLEIKVNCRLNLWQFFQHRYSVIIQVECISSSQQLNILFSEKARTMAERKEGKGRKRN